MILFSQKLFLKFHPFSRQNLNQTNFLCYVFFFKRTLKINEASNQKTVFDKKYQNIIAHKKVFIKYDRKMTILVINCQKMVRSQTVISRKRLVQLEKLFSKLYSK